MRSRLDFVRLLGGAPLLANLRPGAPVGRSPRPAEPDERFDAALVLSGGAARGAYEAGVIAALVQAAGIADGERLPAFQAVVGTSVGSLNAYLVATGQYARLASVWHNIANEDLFAPKARFRAIGTPSSGVLTRLYQAVALERGLVTNVTGILDRDRVAAFIARTLEGDRTPLVPLVFTATNLSEERAEVFYRSAAPIDPSEVATGQAALRSVAGRETRVREADSKVLPQALLASTAIPVLFDPVELTFDGTTSQYIDGGIVDNTPVDIARTLAKTVYTVLVDPQQPPHTMYENALEIGSVSFGAAQRRILETALRSASLESEGKSLFAPTATAEQRAFLEQIFDSRLFTIRPAAELALAYADFSSQTKIDQAYAQGLADGGGGWQAYRRPTFTPAHASAR